MKLAFWGAAALIGYTYFGYPAWLWLRCRWRARPVNRTPYWPRISIVMVVRNEAAHLPQKLKSLTQIDYPAERVELVVVSDGSKDDTNGMLSDFVSVFASRVILNPQVRGKAAGLNDAIKAACGEIVVFADVRQEIESDAVRLLVENFADSRVGCVSGELMLGSRAAGETVRGLGLYWMVEKRIRELEAFSDSMIGTTGALYAVRRNLLVPLPPETILDDVYIPMHVARQGSRVVFDSRARVWDQPDLGTNREFARKVRTLSGNYQLLELAPWLLSRANPLRFEFISHKLMRLLVPFAMATLLIASCFVSGPIYRTALVLQLLFYILSAWASLEMFVGKPRPSPLRRIADAAFTLVLLNTAAVVALANFLTGRKVAWGR